MHQLDAMRAAQEERQKVGEATGILHEFDSEPEEEAVAAEASESTAGEEAAPVCTLVVCP
jgi:hypothetical protein